MIAKSIDGMVLSVHSTIASIAAGEYPSLGHTLASGIGGVTAGMYRGKREGSLSVTK